MFDEILTKDDSMELSEIGKRMANCNGEYLQTVIAGSIERMKNYLKNLEGGYEQQSKLYRSLSICAGCFLIIILM